MTDTVQHLESLGKAIQFAQESHRVTGQNLANINTPGYHALEVPFEQLLTRLNAKQSSETIDQYSVSEIEGLTERADGNNVDLENELAALRKNALAYQTLTQLLGSKMGILKQAITG